MLPHSTTYSYTRGTTYGTCVLESDVDLGLVPTGCFDSIDLHLGNVNLASTRPWEDKVHDQ